MGEIELTVHRDGVMNRAEQRPTVGHDSEQATAERLVVVHDVEIGPAAGEQLAGPQREGPGLGEAGGAHDPELEGVGGCLELRELRHAERVRLPVQVEARHRRELDPLGQLRVRLPGEHRHLVAEPCQLVREMPGVDTLAATTWIAPVDEIRDAKPLRISVHDAPSLPASLVSRNLGSASWASFT